MPQPVKCAGPESNSPESSKTYGGSNTSIKSKSPGGEVAAASVSGTPPGRFCQVRSRGPAASRDSAVFGYGSILRSAV